MSPRSRGDVPGCLRRHPREREGAGDTGCALHPRSRVQYVRVERTRAYRFSGNTPASPAQWLYGLWRALLGDEFCLVTVAAGLMADRSGWIDVATGSLTSATDAGTTRFCRTRRPVFAKRLRRARRRSSACREPLTGRSPPCDHLCAPTLPRPPHPIPRS
jgi:hypothetical protein